MMAASIKPAPQRWQERQNEQFSIPFLAGVAAQLQEADSVAAAQALCRARGGATLLRSLSSSSSTPFKIKSSRAKNEFQQRMTADAAMRFGAFESGALQPSSFSMKITDDYRAKIGLWAQNPHVIPNPPGLPLPRFSFRKFSTHQEMNEWKKQLLFQIAQDSLL